MRGGQKLFGGKIVSNLYTLETPKFNRPNPKLANLTYSLEDDLMEIHRNHGHASIIRLEKITKHIPTEIKKNFECIHCIKGKMTKSAFKETSKLVSKVFEQIHLDLMGPLKPQSKGGHQYILKLVDNASGYIGAFPMKSKDKTSNILIDLMEKEYRKRGSYPSEVCSDGGSEFFNQKLKMFYESKHIRQITSEPYHPEHNGKAKRANRTLIESTRTMLKDAKLPANLWHEVIKASSLMLNQICRDGQDESPWARVHGYKLPSSFIKPIRNPCVFLLSRREKGQKFKDKGEEGILHVKFLKMANPQRSNLLLSEDEVFTGKDKEKVNDPCGNQSL